MDYIHYGTIEDADDFFAHMLHGDDWAGLMTQDKEKALHLATEDVDALLYAGHKTTVYDLLQADPSATADQIATAEAAQALEFPRDGSDEVPEDILRAVYEIAYMRAVRGREPHQEVENLWLTSEGVGSHRASYDRTGQAPRHLANGIVSWVAWRLLQPFLANRASFKVRRA